MRETARKFGKVATRCKKRDIFGLEFDWIKERCSGNLTEKIVIKYSKENVKSEKTELRRNAEKGKKVEKVVNKGK